MNYGVLYLISSPIGNYEDITLRALKTLAEVDLIAAEDTRNTGLLLAHHGLKKTMLSFHEHNEEQRTEDLIGRLKAGGTIALISDAGTPTISDPGYRLVNRACQENLRVIPLPGPCAAITALSASGLPTDSFVFAGFPPKNNAKCILFLNLLAKDQRTVIFYISPKRLLSFMDELIEAMGDRFAVLAREMTKPYEEFLRGPLSALKEIIGQRKTLKGELTLIVKGAENNEEIDWEAIVAEVSELLADPQASVRDVSRLVAGRYGISKNKVYRMAMDLRFSS